MFRKCKMRSPSSCYTWKKQNSISPPELPAVECEHAKWKCTLPWSWAGSKFNTRCKLVRFIVLRTRLSRSGMHCIDWMCHVVYNRYWNLYTAVRKLLNCSTMVECPGIEVETKSVNEVYEIELLWTFSIFHWRCEWSDVPAPRASIEIELVA